MAEIIKKSDLEFVPESGCITRGGSVIVPVPRDIVTKLYDIDTAYQQAIYLKEQPDAVASPSLKGFKRKSSRKDFTLEKPETPSLDAHTQEGLEFAAEIDAVARWRSVNNFIEKNWRLLEWVDSETIINVEDGVIVPFDIPTLGNPLELRAKDLIEIFSVIAEVELPEVHHHGLAV